MPNPERRQTLKAELLSLGYPWPEHLEDKSLEWLEAEIKAIKISGEGPRAPRT